MDHTEYLEAKKLFRQLPKTAQWRQSIWSYMQSHPEEVVNSLEMGKAIKAMPSEVSLCFAQLVRAGYAEREPNTEFPTPTKSDPLKVKTVTQIRFVKPWTNATKCWEIKR